MEQLDLRPWYKKRRYLVALGLAGLFVMAGASGDSAPVTITPALAHPVQVTPSSNTTPVRAIIQPQTQTYGDSTNLSNDNYYTNSKGNTVHSPAYSNSVPAGASAQCRDGTYSFSQSRRGTCSHHGGVAKWL